MRFAAIADIHGNDLALEAVLADIAGQGIPDIVNLGDCFSGPLEAGRVAERLLSLAIPTVRGNHDRYLIEQRPQDMHISDAAAFRQLGPAHLDWLQQQPPARPLQVFLKFDSGMHRLGFPLADHAAIVARARSLSAVAGVTLMTHFAQADETVGVDWQLHPFLGELSAYGLPWSSANSAALLRYPQTLGAWARPGLMLYGASPFADVSAEQLGLRPAMTLQSEIISVQTLQAGEGVGYGQLFRADRPMRVGVVACGYADGYPRHAPTGTPALVDGRLSRTLGRVSMDMLCVDLGECPEAGVGSRVVLWGEGLPVDTVAAAAGTSSYELLCALAARVPVEETD